MLLVIILSSGCGSDSNDDTSAVNEDSNEVASNIDIPNDSEGKNHGTIVRITVRADGTVNYDGSDISLDEVRQKLSELPSENSAVWYFREDVDGDVPDAAMAVAEAVVEAQLPIRLSNKADFSDLYSTAGLDSNDD